MSIDVLSWRQGREPRLSGSHAWPASALYPHLSISGLARLRDGGGLSEILAGYANAGEGFVAQMEGAFSVAIYDRTKRRLVCARDGFGKVPAFLLRTAKTIAWSIDRARLMDVTLAVRELDDIAIAQFLGGKYVEHARTEYKGLERIAPGHVVVVDADLAATTHKYWSLSPQASSARPAERFREIFFDAVRHEQDASPPPAILLSGGLDSSSIACAIGVNPPARATTFSYVFDETPNLSERPYIEKVLQHGRFEPHFVAGDRYNAFDAYDAILSEQDALAPALGLPLTRKLYRTAAESGVSVLLDGHGGDEVVSHGVPLLTALARAKNWRALWREARGLAHLYDDNAAFIFASHALAASWRWRALQKHLRAGQEAIFGKDPRLALRPYGPLLTRDFYNSTEIGDRVSAYARDQAKRTDPSQAHAATLEAPLQAIAFETLFYASRAFGLELRFPFWDKALAEFCIGLDARQKLRAGFSKLILRRAMARTLPQAIRARRDKLDFLPHGARSLLGADSARIEHILADDPEQVSAFVDMAHVRRSYSRLCKQQCAAHGYDVRAVWRTVALSLFLTHVRAKNARRISDLNALERAS